MDMRRMVSWTMSLAALLSAQSRDARASTGVCDSNPPTSTQACISAIQATGGVVNDIFRDSMGRTGTQLPVFGKLFSIYPSQCTNMNYAGCNPGTDTAPYDCPGQYTCVTGVQATVTSVGNAVNALDHVWGHPCRLIDHTLTNGCPNFTVANCIADGTGGAYIPWEGLVFDLGGPSNQVAIFAMNDHGPQPCESAEYTVYLTNNPQSKDIVLNPTTLGADPTKWNRAVLKKIFTEGWYKTRNADPAGHGTSCGDTAQYAVENDAMVTVYSMPCGIAFRYAAIVAGNDGLDFPACAFDSQEAELDAVAGLTENGTGICPDADGDTYVDCACPTAPPICDCDDHDPNTHPNAPEACDASKDYNCNGHHPEPCAAGLACNDSICIPTCAGPESFCPVGSSCQVVDSGQRLCVPSDCTVGGCPPGAVCDAQTKKCVPACNANVVCPVGQKCVSGECVDPCRDVRCSAGFTCVDGTCTPPCSCFAGDVGCTMGQKCDRPTDGGAGSNLCLPPDCVGVTCASGKHCKAGAGCVGYCDGVKCPQNEVCVPPSGDGGARSGCVNLCAGVTCASGTKCDPADGQCKSASGDGGLVVPDAGLDDGGGVDAGIEGGTFGADTSGNESGCGCSVLGASDSPYGVALAGGLGLLGALALRRRRR